jgi:hypothetical protein
MKADLLTTFVPSDVPFLAMETGEWTIIIQAETFDFTVMRKFQLIASEPKTTVVIVRPN